MYYNNNNDMYFEKENKKLFFSISREYLPRQASSNRRYRIQVFILGLHRGCDNRNSHEKNKNTIILTQKSCLLRTPIDPKCIAILLNAIWSIKINFSGQMKFYKKKKNIITVVFCYFSISNYQSILGKLILRIKTKTNLKTISFRRFMIAKSIFLFFEIIKIHFIILVHSFNQ